MRAIAPGSSDAKAVPAPHSSVMEAKKVEYLASNGEPNDAVWSVLGRAKSSDKPLTVNRPVSPRPLVVPVMITRYQTFQGGSPDAQCDSRTDLSLSVSIGCQNPS